MKMKSTVALIAMGVAGTLAYQNIKNGNYKKIIARMDRAKIKMIDDLEDMM